jgi:two-component system cell cycle response regulator
MGAVFTDSSILGLIAGILAVIGVVVASSTGTPAASAVDDVPVDMESLHRRLADVERTLEEERRQHDTTRQNLAEYLATQPPPGSLDRKIIEQVTIGIEDLEAIDPSDIRLLADPETNLFSEAYFRVSLDARIASARRHLRPVAIALVSVIEGEAIGGCEPSEPSKVTAAIRQTLRDADTACRLADGSYALILEDTPENGAVWTVERIRRNLNTRHGLHTMWAGVACYPAHAFSTDELLDQAVEALHSAKEWKQDRIEIATSE